MLCGRGCVQLQQDWRINNMANACRNLVSASLEGCKFDRAAMTSIITRNPHLVQLNFTGLSAFTNATCKLLAKSCPMLETLNVSFCGHADGHGLRKVVEACRHLRDLRACELNMNDPMLMQALFVRNTLERLQLGETTGVTDEMVRLLVEGADPVIDPATDRSMAPPRKLAHLDLRKCTRLTDNALRHLADNVPQLRRLELGGVVGLTDAGFAQLLPTVPRLSHLDVEECVELTNAMLVSLAESPAAKRMLHLQVSQCENMSDPGFIEVLRKCERLRELEMDNSEFWRPGRVGNADDSHHPSPHIRPNSFGSNPRRAKQTVPPAGDQRPGVAGGASAGGL